MNRKILLLSCCAPCSCAVIEKMARDGEDLTVVFYNPNITPQGEYVRRLAENKRVCENFGVPFVDLKYDVELWKMLTQGLEDEPERGRRCDVCFHMRIKRVMEYAKEHGFDAVASVLGVSRYKDLEQVNRAAARACEETGVQYIHVEGRKGGMQERRLELTDELDLYEQTYCGCRPR